MPRRIRVMAYHEYEEDVQAKVLLLPLVTLPARGGAFLPARANTIAILPLARHCGSPNEEAVIV
jgi:hypothetical protein